MREDTTPITPATPTLDPTTNWKTYKNSKYGFSLSYPQSSSIIEDAKKENYYDKVATLTGTENFSMDITVLTDIDIYATSTAESIAGRESNDSGTDHTVSATSVNSYQAAIVFLASNPEIEEVFIKHSQKNVTVKLSAALSSKNNEETFDQILSTFKFLENNPVMSNKTCQYNGKTYRDGEAVPADKCNSCMCDGNVGQIACTLRACE